MKKSKYIVAEGVPGGGKTTIAEFVANHLNSSIMYEIVEENPFLEKFYQDPNHWGFQTECFFLCNRYMQLKDIQRRLEGELTVVGDYHIMKNLIFAGLTLKGEELEKYKQLYKTMIQGFPYPDIIIYSDANLDEIMRRINLRGRKMEEGIDSGCIDSLISSYKENLDLNNLNKNYPGTQLIRINSDSIDFFKNPEKLNELYSLVDNAIKDENLLYQELK